MIRVAKSLFAAMAITSVLTVFSMTVIAPRWSGVLGSPLLEQTRVITERNVSRLRIHNRAGTVRVRSGTGEETRVVARVRVYGRRSDALESAKAYAQELFIVERNSDAVLIHSEPRKRPDELALRVDYDVTVPVDTAVEVRNREGNIRIGRGCGAVDVRGRNTDIEVTEPHGPVVARSTNGRIRVLNAPADVEIQTVNGNVYAHVLGGRLSARTANGTVLARVMSDRVEAVDASSDNGGVVVILQTACPASVHAVTGNGVVYTDLALDTGNGVRARQEVEGTIHGGGALLNLRALNGNIWIAGDR